PLDSRRLCMVVEDLALRPAGGERSVPAVDDETDPALDAVLARVGGDRELLAEITRLFIEDAPRHLASVTRAIDTGSAEGLRRAAHGLKGAAANFDAEPVVDVARELEEIGRTAELHRAPAVLDRLRAEIDRLLATLRTINL